jgi:uncharacterized membrane protein (UPF0127 family)
VIVTPETGCIVRPSEGIIAQALEASNTFVHTLHQRTLAGTDADVPTFSRPEQATMSVDIFSKSNEQKLIARARVATSMWSRFWGLMGRRSLPNHEGLLIDPCNSVHTFFMRFPIDVLFLDEDDRVLKITTELRPFRVAVGRGARRVLEIAAGRAASAGVRVGDKMTLREHL